MKSLPSKISYRGGMALVLAVAACSVTTLALQQQQAPAPSASAPQVAHALPPNATTLSTAAARRDAWKALTDGVADKNGDHRAEAITALGTIGIRPDVVRLVESGLIDENVTVREAAAIALGTMKSRGSTEKLRVALEDKSPVVIFAAAQALWQMGDKSGESVFTEVLAGDRGVSRGTVQDGLHYAHQQLHDPKGLAELGAEQTAGAFLGPVGFGVAVLAELAKDKGAPARAISARLLGSGGDTDSRMALQEALDDKSWLVRATAAEALGTARDSSMIAMLAPLLQDDQLEVRYKAAAAIMRSTSAR